MTDKERIRAEIERLIDILERNSGCTGVFGDSQMAAYEKILSFIDSMQEEPEGNNEEISLLPVAQGFTSNLHWTTLKGGTLDWHDPETGNEVNIEKAYTNLEQSKKLAEILPLESYDMYWDLFDTAGRSYTPHLGEVHIY